MCTMPHLQPVLCHHQIISRELVEHGAIEVPEDGDANESTTEDVEAAVIGLLDILKVCIVALMNALPFCLSNDGK